ncbi:MAG: sporulation protein YqfD [Oscillospiraceae bacterium]
MFDNIRGVVRFCAEGSRLYQFINAIKEKGIICKNQRCINNKFYGNVYNSDFKYIEEIASDYGISVNIAGKKGLIYKLMKYRKRYGFMAGLIIVPLFIVFISGRAVIIEINGNEKNSDEQIISILADAGIEKGGSLSDVDYGYAEQYLRLNLDNVVWVGIRHTGCRVVVDIDEGEDMPEIISERTPANIVSAKDAQIVSVNVLVGQLDKLVNDGVKKGDILISGVYSDDKGNIRCVHSLGSIIGIYNESVVFSQSFENTERNSTDNIIEQNFLEAFGFRIPLFIKKDLPYDFEYTENTEPFELFGKELPFGIVNTEYTEYVSENVTYSEEQAENILMEKVERYERNFISDAEILERDIQKNISDDRIEYIVNYKLKGEIGTTEEILMGRPEN